MHKLICLYLIFSFPLYSDVEAPYNVVDAKVLLYPNKIHVSFGGHLYVAPYLVHAQECPCDLPEYD